MTNIPKNLKYTKEHEWVQISGDVATIGITDYAQSSLGDIVFMELPEVGTIIKKDSTFGVVESIKSVSDLFVPLSGKIIESNTELTGQPEKCNQDPYGSWMIKIKLSDPSEQGQLLSSEKYESCCH